MTIKISAWCGGLAAILAFASESAKGACSLPKDCKFFEKKS